MRPIRTLSLLAAILVVAGSSIAPAQQATPGGQPQQAHVDRHGDPLPEAAIARLGTTRYRHGGMDPLAFTPDGKAMIFNGSGALSFMDAATGITTKKTPYGEAEPRLMRRLGMSESQAVISGDTKVLAFASARGMGDSVTVIDTDTGKERRRFSQADLFKNGQQFFEPPGVALNHDGKWLLVYPNQMMIGRGGPPGGKALPIAWLDTTTGQRVHEIEPDKDCQFSQARFSRDGRQVLVVDLGDNNGKARLRVFDAIRGGRVRA